MPSTIINGIGAFFGTLWGWLTDIVDGIANIAKSIIDLLGDLLKSLFVPSNDFWQGQFDDFKTLVDRKMGVGAFTNVIDSLGGVGSAGLPNVTLSVMGISATIIDFSLLSKALPTMHLFIRAFAMWWIVNYCINNVYKVIRKDDIEE